MKLKIKDHSFAFLGLFLLLFICSVTTVSAETTNPFVDVSRGTYYYKPVQWAYEDGITVGRTPTKFCPFEYCTRGQVVTFLWRAAGEPEPKSTECPFEDVDEAQFASYYKAILWAAEEKIANGYSDGTFQPLRKVTRAEFVTFQYRSNGSPDVDISENPFIDVDDVKHKNLKKAIIWAYKNSSTQGKDSTHFQPDVYCNRCNVVTFIYRDKQDGLSFNGHLYRVYAEKLTWEKAKVFCEEKGGHLVTITSKEEQDAIFDYIQAVAPNTDLWIGISDASSEGNWSTWITGEPVTYSNWGPNEPDNMNGQDYGVICNGNRKGANFTIAAGQWDDISNRDTTNLGYFICEWE